MPSCTHDGLRGDAGWCFFCTKRAGLNGQGDELSRRDLAWSGTEIGWRSPGRGWRSPELPPAALSDLDDVPDLDPPLARALSRLSSAQQTDFLA